MTAIRIASLLIAVALLCPAVSGHSRLQPNGAAAAAASQTKYSVYCANGKIEIDSRTMEEMKSARGSDTCKFGEFDFLSDAQSFAKQFGGEGAPCRCK